MIIASPRVNYSVFNNNVATNASFSISPTSITDVLAGETYSFSIAPTPGATTNGNTQSGTPLPPWLNIDPQTGRLFGTGPASAPVPYQWLVDVIMTTVRDGRSYESRVTLDFELP